MMMMMKRMKSIFQCIQMSIFETAQRQCLEKCGDLIKRKVHFIWANQISSQPVKPVRVSSVLVKLTDSKKFQFKGSYPR